MDTADEVLTAARERAAALAAGDAEALRALLHPDLRWTSFRGEVFAREAYVARNTGGQVRWRGQRLEDVEVLECGHTAVLVALAVDEIEDDDGVEQFRLRLTQTWVRHEGRWVVLAAHAGPRI